MTTVFLFCAVLGGVFLILQSLLGIGHVELGHHDFGGHDTHAHTGSHHDSARGALNLRSVRGLATGVMMFGLMGGYLSSLGWPVGPVLVAAAGFGLLCNILVALFFSKIAKVESDGTPRPADAVGRIAIAYTTIPMATKPPFTGRIQVSVGGGIIEMPAYTRPGLNDITIGQRVFVKAVQNGVAEVEEAVNAG